jgi:cell division protein FtsW
LLTTVCAALFFLAGMRWFWMAAFGAIALLGAIGTYVMVPHVASRVDRFVNPEHGDAFQVNTALSAFAQGGLTGVGPGEGTVKFVLPDAHTDFIFAVFSEEFGLFGNLVLVTLFLFVIGRGLFITFNASTLFTRLVAGAITLTLFTYVFVNMGMVSGVLPVVGVPLPMISYGGTSLVSILFALGILMSIHTHKRLVKS